MTIKAPRLHAATLALHHRRHISARPNPADEYETLRASGQLRMGGVATLSHDFFAVIAEAMRQLAQAVAAMRSRKPAMAQQATLGALHGLWLAVALVAVVGSQRFKSPDAEWTAARALEHAIMRAIDQNPQFWLRRGIDDIALSALFFDDPQRGMPREQYIAHMEALRAMQGRGDVPTERFLYNRSEYTVGAAAVARIIAFFDEVLGGDWYELDNGSASLVMTAAQEFLEFGTDPSSQPPVSDALLALGFSPDAVTHGDPRMNPSARRGRRR